MTSFCRFVEVIASYFVVIAVSGMVFYGFIGGWLTLAIIIFFCWFSFVIHGVVVVVAVVLCYDFFNIQE